MKPMSEYAAYVALEKYEKVGECLVLYRYEWTPFLELPGGERTYWAHVKFEEGNEDRGDRWIEISAEDEIDMCNVFAVAPLPETQCTSK